MTEWSAKFCIWKGGISITATINKKDTIQNRKIEPQHKRKNKKKEKKVPTRCQLQITQTPRSVTSDQTQKMSL